MLEEFHNGLSGGHYSARTTTTKIMQVGYYWLNLFKDAHLWVRKCKECALFAGKTEVGSSPFASHS
ncbi:hypothetical protein KI387_017218, partial [Taxus chinensis]